MIFLIVVHLYQLQVTAAHGHRGLTILVSLLCTIISVFTIPPMVAWLVPTLQHVHIDVGQVLLNAVLRVLLPLFVSIKLHLSNYKICAFFQSENFT